MKKRPVGIIDMGFEGFSTLGTFSAYLKNEDLLYINDLKNAPYEGKEEKQILEYIKENVEILLSNDIKMLIVLSDCIVEYAYDYLKSLKIPVFNIVDLLVEHVNEFYEQKNMVLLAKNSVIEANLYQKNFRYNHLYNIPADNMEQLVISNEIKTSKSFSTTKESLRPAIKKEVDIIICSSPFIALLKTELYEFLPYAEILDPGEILAIKASKNESLLYPKKRGKIFVMTGLTKKELKKRMPWYYGKFIPLPFPNRLEKQEQSLM